MLRSRNGPHPLRSWRSDARARLNPRIIREVWPSSYQPWKGVKSGLGCPPDQDGAILKCVASRGCTDDQAGGPGCIRATEKIRYPISHPYSGSLRAILGHCNFSATLTQRLIASLTIYSIHMSHGSGSVPQSVSS
jgi:hypothetical protein